MADNLNVIQLESLLMAGKRQGKQEFVVLATVESAGAHIEVEFLGSGCRLEIEGMRSS